MLKQLFVIAERRKSEKIKAALASSGASEINTVYADGTARSDILEVLGLDSSERMLITASVPPERVAAIMDTLERDYSFGKGGGVAFTVNMTAVSGPASLHILSGGLL